MHVWPLDYNPLPVHDSIEKLANEFGDFFVNKIERIRREIDEYNIEPPVLPSEPTCQEFTNFVPLSECDVRKLIMDSKTTSCELDPIPTDLLKQCVDVLLPVLTKMQTCQVSRIWRETHAFCPQITSYARKGGREQMSHSFHSTRHISESTRPTRKYDLPNSIRIRWRSHLWTSFSDLHKAFMSRIYFPVVFRGYTFTC